MAYVIIETPVFQDKGTLQQFVGQGWTQIGTGTSTIWVLQSNDTNASRIVILDNVTGSYSVNQAVGADLAFQKATDTFVQWKVTDGTVYGMTFELQTPASQFTDALGKAVQRLTGIAPAAALPPPVTSSSSSNLSVAASTASSSAGGGLPAPMTTRADGAAPNTARPTSGKEKDKKEKEKEKDKKDKDKDKKVDKRRSVKPERRDDSLPSSSALPAAILNESPEEAARRKRREAAKEIFTSEETYVKSLMDLVSIWKIPMKSKGILTDPEISVLFSNVDSLMQLNTVLLHELKVRIENWSDTTKIGDVFVKNSIYLKNYKQYYETYNDAQTILAGLPKKKNYSAFAKSAESSSGQSLTQLLALPFQRVPRYLLLLRELINKTPQEHPDHADLQDALIQIAAVAAELEKGIADANFAKRLQAVISRNYIGLTPLLVPHRILHMEGELEVTAGGFSKGNVVLVFNDVIAFVIDNAKQKQVVSHIFFDTLWLMPLPPELGPLGFELQTPEITYRCMAKEKSVRDQVYEEIDKQVLADLTKKGALTDHDVGLPTTSERVRTANYTYESGGSYKGEWVNAKMHGKGVRVSSNGSTFEGNFVKGFFHGTGTASYKTGDIYVGDWARDVPHGKGTLTIKTALGEKKYAGDWESGRKKGTGSMVWENGDTYDGGWDNDHFHGRGTLTKKDGSRYEGDWNLGQRHGHGVYIGPRGDRYEGSWENNMKHGKGSYVAPDGSTYTGDFVADQKQGHGVYVPYEGLRYEGEFIANMYTGQGTLTETGGDSYTGGWRGGKRHGLGTLTRPNGERYEGNWHEDKRHGKGSWSNNHGTKYEGEFKDDKKHGQGTITRPDGSSYSGEWAIDRRDGSGVERWPNGASYDGHWKTDVMNGNGTFTWPDGSAYTGGWVNGKRSGKGKLKTTAGTYDGDWKDDLRDGVGSWTSSDGSVYSGEWTADRRNGKGMMNNISEQLWRDGLSVKPGIQHLPPDLPAPYYFN